MACQQAEQRVIGLRRHKRVLFPRQRGRGVVVASRVFLGVARMRAVVGCRASARITADMLANMLLQSLRHEPRHRRSGDEHDQEA
jgi:hypothetical protein